MTYPIILPTHSLMIILLDKKIFNYNYLLNIFIFPHHILQIYPNILVSVL